MQVIVHQSKPIVSDHSRQKQTFEPIGDITIVLDSGNEIFIGKDEQGDSYLKIDGHEIWDNSNR